MTYPVFDTSRIPESIDSHSGVVTCEACGCRLEPVVSDGALSWYHFSPMAGRDARGDRVACADAPHDGHGRARSVAAA
jgi:hypothetical protein